MEDKVIVTNRAALTRKYKSAGMNKIAVAIATLTAADKARGLKTRLIYLDDASIMKKLGGTPVAGLTDYRGTKVAIDAVFSALQPDYLLILGAGDVVPHQDLKNPAFETGKDDDDTAWGDLPYACQGPYSKDPAKFVGPSRVVARLPDLLSANDPSYLLAILAHAAAWKSRPASHYAAYFALSADVWKGSTRLSLDSIFGNANGLLLSPPKGPTHPPAQLRAPMHFINCHGAMATPEFYGQKGARYPIALRTNTVANKISDGTVAAVECCYGGELYDADTLNIDMPICQSYLKQGAYGYFGATTIAYGPADTNGAADLICQYYLLNVLDGASSGRAALMARQQYVDRVGQMDPIDLKTLAQFCLYGDPSIHPVAAPVKAAPPKDVKEADAERFFRSERREKLKLRGTFLQETKPTASKGEAAGKLAGVAKSALANIARDSGLPPNLKFRAFKVKGGAPIVHGKGRGAKRASAPTRYLVAVGKTKKKPPESINTGIAVVAKEVGGLIIGYRVYHQR